MPDEQKKTSGDAATGSGSSPIAPFRFGGVLALSVCHFIHDVYSSFLSPLLPLLIDKLSMSLTQAGFLSTVMQLPHLLNPAIGKLADRTSVRAFIVIAPTMTAVPMCLIGLAPNYSVLLLLLLVAGVSVALFHVPAPVMVARFSGSRVGRGMSFFMTGGELARTVGPLAAVGAVSLWGLEGFYPVMVVGIVSSVLLMLKFRALPAASAGAQQPSIRQTWRDMRFLLLPIGAILTARGFMHAAMSTFLPTFIAAETGNLWLAGISLTIYEAAGVAGILAAGPASDRFGRRTILIISLLGAPVGLALVTCAPSGMRFAALILTGLTLLSTTPVMLALIQEHAGSAPAAANGMFMMVSFMARSATVVVVGAIADAIGLKATYLISAGIGLLAVCFTLGLPNRSVR
jgi:FSR family fosmidomycin resistance protein-like MFS transporter